MTKVKIIFNGVAALFAFVAAVLWWQSTRVKVPSKTQVDAGGFAYAQISYDGVDPFAIAFLQASWNRWAAMAAAIAAGSQAIAILLSISTL